MGIVSTARSSHQNVSNLRIGRGAKTAKPSFKTEAVHDASSALTKAMNAKSRSEYLVHLSTAFKALRDELQSK